MKKRLAVILGVGVVVVAAVALLLLQFGGPRPTPPGPRLRVMALQKLRELDIALKLHQEDHEGAWPDEFDEAFLERYLGGVDLNIMPGIAVHYIVPTPESLEEVVAYYWPPFDGGTALLFEDRETEWVAAEEESGLANPRTGQPIR